MKIALAGRMARFNTKLITPAFGPEEDAAAAAAAEAAAVKAAADKVAADKAAADKAAADKEAGKGMSDTEAALLKENMKRKEAEKTLKAEKEALEKTIAEMKTNFEGIDVAEIRKMLQAKQEQETKDLEQRGEFDKVKQQMREQHAREKADLEKRIADAESKASGKESVIEELTVGSSFASSTFIKEGTTVSAKIARTLFGANFDVADGKTVGYDKPRGAKDRAPLVDGDGNPLAFDKALEVLVKGHEDSAMLLKAKGKQGAGSGSAGPGKTADKGEKAEATGINRISAALAEKGTKKK